MSSNLWVKWFKLVGGVPFGILMSNQSVFSFQWSYIPTTTFGNLMVGACNPLEAYEYSSNTCRSQKIPKKTCPKQEKWKQDAYSHPTDVKIIVWKTNLDCNYSWWTLTTLNLKGRCMQDIFYLSIELDVLINSIAKAWTAKSCNWIWCLNSIAKAWNAKSCNWIWCLIFQLPRPGMPSLGIKFDF